jgi:hypothetical protein
MNQTGVCGTGSRRQAFRNADTSETVVPRLSEPRATVADMDEPIEMLCRDCDVVAVFVQPVTDDPVEDLMCVICGTAVTFAGVLAPQRRAA